GSVTLTSSAGTSYLWSNAATTASINVTTAGSYTVQVTNASGCQSAASAAIVVNVNALPVVNAGTDTIIPWGTSTTLNATVTGTGPFTYSWTPSAQLVDALIEDPTTVNLTTTTVFTLTATSTTTSCSNTDAVLITISGGALSSTPTATPGTVCAGANVQLDAVASGGSGSYTYTWTSVPVGFTSSIANPIAIPTVNTTYSVLVDDGFTTVNSQVVVTVNAIPTINAGADQAICEGASVILSGSGADSYIWDNGVFDGIPFIPTIGTVTYTVIGTTNGCSNTDQVVVKVNAIPNVNAGADQTICKGTSVTLSGSGADSYIWDNGVLDGTPFTPIEGTVTYTVTGTSNGCSNTDQVVVTVNSNPVVDVVVANAECNGGTGSITLTPNGLEYSIDGINYQTVNVFSGLVAGNYSITVSDANLCTSVVSATLTDPAVLSLSCTTVDESAAGQDGQINLTVDGGTTPYSYAWSNLDVTEDISGLTAGTYTVTVTDAHLCTAETTITVNASTCPIIASLVGTNVLCNGMSNGSADLTVINATAPVTYLWSNGNTGEDLADVVAGVYSVVITDAVCSVTSYVTITEPSLLSVVATPTDATCGNLDGAVQLTVSGGTLPYSFSWSNGDTTENLTAIAAGSYSVVITDQNNCKAAANAVVANLGAPTMNYTVENPTCPGLCNASAVIVTTGGTPPYYYTWAYDGHNSAFGFNLCAGTYPVSVVDGTQCLTIAYVTVTDPAPVSITANITGATCGNSDGAITLSVTGGNGVYSYHWANGATTASISSLATGDYIVTVSDGNSCSEIDTFTVNILGGPVVNALVNDASCYTTCDGIAVINVVSGGTPPYTITWAYDGHHGAFALNLCHGTYDVSIADNAGCTIVQSVVIGSPSEILVTSIVIDESTPGSSDGFITVNPSGGMPPYLYQWDANTGNQTTQTASFLGYGIYFVTITDYLNCSVIVSDTIDIIDAVALVNETYSYTIYPNPTNGLVTVELKNMTLSKVEITDVVGRVVYVKEGISDTFIINFEQFNPGVYFLNIHTKDKVYTHKIVLRN
ncbi:MAG: T9SS type A sorting domain-containing protein, partial [Bacteroidia bacterium]|nr:T9SS type A sorting domain-containing protein [Bacteroidia bacterium]